MANPWTEVKRKSRRPLSSIVLQDQVITELVEDVKEFLEADEWYSAAGIPHHRGYLLYGPPGTGKSENFVPSEFQGHVTDLSHSIDDIRIGKQTSVVCVMEFPLIFIKAGELGLEIYSLSLSSSL